MNDPVPTDRLLKSAVFPLKMPTKEPILSRLERQLAAVHVVNNGLTDGLTWTEARKILAREGIKVQPKPTDGVSLAFRAEKLESQRRDYLGTLATAYNLLADNLNRGIPLIDSLQDLEDSLLVPDLRAAFATAKKAVEQGKLLYEGLVASNAFSPIDVTYVRIAEKRGELSPTLRVLAERARYERGNPSWLDDND